MQTLILVIYVINGYDIIRVNNKDVLYLYFDFNYEFSRIDFKSKKDKLEEVVKKFIKDNKIFFEGVTIVLVSGGILFGSINLNTPSFSQISVNNPLIVETFNDDSISVTDISSVINEKEVNDDIKEDVKVDEKEEIKEENFIIQKKQEIISDSNEHIISNKEVFDSKTDKISNIVEENVESNVSTEDFSDVKAEQPKEETKQVIDNNIYINVKKNDGTVLRLELEEYVTGVVGAEMPALFNIEALKAQAVIARTYALKVNSRGQVLSVTESTQSYKNNSELQSLWGSSYSIYYNKIKSAVESTKGMYLSYNGSYIEAVYHSTSNGRTEDSVNVWGNYYSYLVSVDSPYDSSNPSYIASNIISYTELSNKLGFDINSDTFFNILDRTSGDRVLSISVDGNVYSGVEFRNKLGLRSADFDIEKVTDGVNFITRGYGHGVGMSQYGANGMAKNGYSYRDILLHYYSGVSIEQL